MMTPREYNAVTIASIFVLALILFMLATTPAGAQVRYGMLGEQPHTILAMAYNPREVKPAGFCIGRDVERRPVGVDRRDSFVIVHAIVPAFVTGVDTLVVVDTVGARHDTTTKVTERFVCPRGAMSVHFHNFGNCNPSRDDFEQLLEEGTEFSVIYCGVARFYWREEAQAMLRPPLQMRRTSTSAARGIPRTEREHRPWLRAQLVGSAAGIAGIFDPDPSLWTDPDPWTTRDKAEHFIASGNLYALCRVAGAGEAESVGCGVLGSVFWEVGQSVRSPRRFISLKDIAAGVTGAAAGWLAEKALARFR